MRILGRPVDVVSMADTVAMVAGAVERGRAGATEPPRHLVTLNPEMTMRAAAEAELAAAIEGAWLIVPDGVGVVTALRRRGHHAERIAGIDLLERYAARAAASGHRLGLVGAAPGVAAAAAAELRRRHPGIAIVATDSGDPVEATARRAAAWRCDVLLAAYTTGPQELFLARHLGLTGAAVGIGVGGSFDFLAGRVRRAPAPVRRAGLEWAWRLARQPWRLRRQTVLPRYRWAEWREWRHRGGEA